MENAPKSVIQSVLICAVVGISAAFFMTMSGCLAPTAGAGERFGVATYVRGDLEASLAKDFNSVLDATHKAIKELGFAEISAKKEGLGTVVMTRATGGQKIEISITPAGKDLTDIKIRVDLFGDEQLSRSLLDRIKAGI
jgi:hypothetical protein